MKGTHCLRGLVLCLLSLTAGAQQSPAASTTQRIAAVAATKQLRLFISSPEVAQRIAAAGAIASKDGAQLPVAARALVSWGPLRGNVLYRIAPTTHYFANEDYAEFYLILEGAGTMAVGGTMTNPKRTGPRLESTALQGGVPHNVAKGDMLLVPPGTAHRVTRVEGKLVYMSMHIPLQPSSGTGLASP
jgi:mannose-6-phosphate isomerase-like protein (cupin superfamily)